MKDERPPIAERMASARKDAGLTIQEISQEIGLSECGYRDVEDYTDDAFMTMSLFQILLFASKTQTNPRSLVTEIGTEACGEQIAIHTVVERIKSEMESRSESAEEFGNRVGWGVSGALRDPMMAWHEWNLDALQDICREVNLDWRLVLPDSDSWHIEPMDNS